MRILRKPGDGEHATTTSSGGGFAPGKATLTGRIQRRAAPAGDDGGSAGGAPALATPDVTAGAGASQLDDPFGLHLGDRPLTLAEEFAKVPPNYPRVFAALNKLNMLDLVKRLEGFRMFLPDLLDHLSDGFAGTHRIRAAIRAVQLKGTPTDTADGAARLKAVLDELTAAKVAIWERVDVAVYLEGSAGPMRKRVLDELAATIDAGIVDLKDVELLHPSKEKGGPLDKDRAEVAAKRDGILRLVHDYMRLVDADLLVLTGTELAWRQEEKKRFDHFKMMRESERLTDVMLKTSDPTAAAEAKKRKYQLDALLADGKMGFRKPVGTNGMHGGEIYVVYEDCVKLGGDPAWLNNNPGNVIASPLATNLKNDYTIRRFAIFPTMALGFAAIPMMLKEWREESPGWYTLLRTFSRWANGKTDNPAEYTAAVADELNKAGVKAGVKKITASTRLDDLSVPDLMFMGERMAQRVEKMRPGTTLYRSDIATNRWLVPLLGDP